MSVQPIRVQASPASFQGVGRTAAVLLVLVLSACGITRPTVTQLVTAPPLFMVSAPLTFKPVVQKEESIVVPAGFVTDLASIPRLLWWWSSPQEATMAPAILHDFLYWEQPCSKDEADAAMYVAMRQVGMTDSAAYAIYLGVRTAPAEVAWNQNRILRASGESRFFSQRYIDRLMASDVQPGATWGTIKVAASRVPYGFATHTFPVSSIKLACLATLAEFRALRST